MTPPPTPPQAAPLRVALIGFGAIGATVWRLLRDAPDRVTLTGLLLRESNARAQAAATGASQGAAVDRHAQARAQAGAAQASLVHRVDDLLATGPDLVVECAGHDALDAYGEATLRAGRDLVVVSVGALADPRRHDALLAAAREAGRQLIVPAGAIGGLDILGAARLAGLHSVCYRSRKPPLAWRGTPAEGQIDLLRLRAPTVFYRGRARDAALQYPKNANVAATLALATLGFEHTRVELVADPGADGNFHEIDAHGRSGSVTIRIEGVASPSNPRTSMVTAYSVARAVLNRREALVI